MRRIASLAVFLVVFAAVALAQQATQPASQATQAAQAPQAQQAPRMPASPRGSAATQIGGRWVEPTTPGGAPRYTDGKWITVDYGRPILRGRTNIFGSAADYGKKVNDDAPVWRAGANQTTRFKTEVPLVIGGKTLPAGEYSLFVELAPKSWTLILSTEPFQQKYDPNNKTETWGAYNYDPKFDVLRAPMTLAMGAESVDQFTIQFADVTATGGKLMLLWEKDVASVPFTMAK
jgi:hypothetical protein